MRDAQTKSRLFHRCSLDAVLKWRISAVPQAPNLHMPLSWRAGERQRTPADMDLTAAYIGRTIDGAV